MRLAIRPLYRSAWLLVAAALLPALSGCGPGKSNAEPERVTAVAPKAPAKATSAPAAPAPSGPQLELSQRGVTLNWVEKGVTRMKATAVKGQISELTKVGVLSDFSAKLYDNGKMTTTMVAPKVTCDTINRVVTATGGVTMTSLDRGTVVKAKWMKWFEKKQKVIGDGGVEIHSDVWNAKGAAFEADTALKSLSIRNSTKGLEGL